MLTLISGRMTLDSEHRNFIESKFKYEILSEKDGVYRVITSSGEVRFIEYKMVKLVNRG